MKNRLAALRAKLDGALKALRAITDKADAENRDLNAEEITETEKLKGQIDQLTKDITTEQAAVEAERILAAARQGADSDVSVTGGEDRATLDPTRGFRTVAEFVRAVLIASAPRGAVDKRLGAPQFEAAAPTTFGQESVGQDGGYLVPPEYTRRIFQHSLDEGSFLPLTMQLPIEGNSMTFPVDETTPWGSDGVRVYWSSEATAAQQTKPKFGERTLRLRKLLGLVPLTDELMADATASGAYVTLQLGRSLAWKTNDAIVNGPGGQIPIGYRSSGAIVTQDKETAQVADTVNVNNIAKMFGRLPAGSMRSSSLRWLLNNDVLNQVMTLTLGNQPIWTPPQEGFKSAPVGFLLGRPIEITQVCQTLGDLGDIQLVDFAQYVTISKGPEYAESMHLFFDFGLGAFRLTFRMDGQPWQSAPVTPANGSNTLSPFVQLQARA